MDTVLQRRAHLQQQCMEFVRQDFRKCGENRSHWLDYEPRLLSTLRPGRLTVGDVHSKVQVLGALCRSDHDAVRLRDAGSGGLVWEEWIRDVLRSRFCLRADTLRQYESLMMKRVAERGDTSRSNKRRSVPGPSTSAAGKRAHTESSVAGPGSVNVRPSPATLLGVTAAAALAPTEALAPSHGSSLSVDQAPSSCQGPHSSGTSDVICPTKPPPSHAAQPTPTASSVAAEDSSAGGETNCPPHPLFSLDPHLVTVIMGFLCLNDLISCIHVCKGLHSLLRSADSLWRIFVLPDHTELNRLRDLCSVLDVGSCTMQHLSIGRLRIMKPRSTTAVRRGRLTQLFKQGCASNVTHFSLKGPLFWLDREAVGVMFANMPLLQELHLTPTRIYQAWMDTIPGPFPHLRRLTARGVDDSTNWLCDLRAPALETLEITSSSGFNPMPVCRPQHLRLNLLKPFFLHGQGLPAMSWARSLRMLEIVDPRNELLDYPHVYKELPARIAQSCPALEYARFHVPFRGRFHDDDDVDPASFRPFDALLKKPPRGLFYLAVLGEEFAGALEPPPPLNEKLVKKGWVFRRGDARNTVWKLHPRNIFATPVSLPNAPWQVALRPALMPVQVGQDSAEWG